MSTCKIRGCDEEIHFYHLRVCKACYSGLSYWKGRTQYDKGKRLTQLKRLNGRMKHMIDYPRNVPKKRRKA